MPIATNSAISEAVNNYLLRLGWGHGDAEIISRDQVTQWFDLANVGRSPSRFDFKKLENLNGHYIREADDARSAGLPPRVETLVGRALDDADRDLLTRAIESLKPRAKTLDEIAEGALFLFGPAAGSGRKGGAGAKGRAGGSARQRHRKAARPE